MDRAFQVTPIIVLNNNKNALAWTQTLAYRPPQEELKQRRGILFSLLNFKALQEQEEGGQEKMATLSRQIFHTLSEEYFSQDHGGISLALQTAWQRVKERQQLLLGPQPRYQVNLILTVIWGNQLYFIRDKETFLFLWRQEEIINYNNQESGEEILKDKDVIILCEPVAADYWQNQKFTRILAERSSGEWKEFLQQEINQLKIPATAPGMLLLQIKVEEKPGEEEIMDIGVIEEPELRPQIPSFITKYQNAFPQKVALHLPRFWRHFNLKTITNHFQGKGLTLLLLLLLFASILFNFQRRQQKERENQRQALKQEIERLISAGEEAMASDPSLSQRYLKEIKGIWPQLDSNLQTELDPLRQKLVRHLYRLKLLQLEPSDSWPAAAEQRLVFWEEKEGVINWQGEVVLPPQDEWQNIVALDTYSTPWGSNIYLLEQNGKIYKYPVLPQGGYGPGQDYLEKAPTSTNAIDLSINGAIYILFQGGEVKKFFRGNEVEFQLKGIYPSLQNAQAIFTSPELKNIYLFTTKRILAFDKEGNYQQGWELNSNLTLNSTNIFINAEEDTLWLGSKNQVWSGKIE